MRGIRIMLKFPRNEKQEIINELNSSELSSFFHTLLCFFKGFNIHFEAIQTIRCIQRMGHMRATNSADWVNKYLRVSHAHYKVYMRGRCVYR